MGRIVQRRPDKLGVGHADAHGSTTVLADDDEVAWSPDKAPEVRAPDGDQLWPLLQAVLDADEGSGHPTSAS